MTAKTHSYYKSIKLESLSRDEYNDINNAGVLHVIYPEATGIYQEDVLDKKSRIDQIAQNGNDGLHYRVSGSDNPDGISWPDPSEENYNEVIEKLYELDKDNMFVDDYVEGEGCRGHDMVSNPSHYELGNTGVEAIDVIEASLTKEEYIGYLRGNCIKYQLRANKKNGTEDLKKADIYSGWLVEALEE